MEDQLRVLSPHGRIVVRSLTWEKVKWSLAALVAVAATFYIPFASAQMAKKPHATGTLVTPFKPGNDLRWFRTSAERKAAYTQAYSLAATLVERRKTTGTWIVVMDADETIFDNSEVQDRLARFSQEPTQDDITKQWDEWVKEERAPVFESAHAFIDNVHSLHGKVVVVTNRPEPQCQATRNNFQKQALQVEAILCAQLDAAGKLKTDKTDRFQQVASGAATHETDPTSVVLFIGDSIRDCPGQAQSKFDVNLFGNICIVLPNPMYGSWTGNEYPPKP